MEGIVATAVLAVLVVAADGAQSVESRFSICKVQDKNFQDCFKKSVEKAITGVLSDGIPELGVLPLDPLSVPQMTINTGDGPVGFELKFDNSTHTGIRGAKVVQSSADPKNYKFSLKFTVPHYTVSGPYEARGRIVLLPITGKGLSNFTYHDLNVQWEIEGKPKPDAQGKIFMEPTRFDVKIHSDRASIDMTNLFNGDKTLGDEMLKFLNENQKDFLGEVEPALNEAFSQLFLGLSKQIFKKLPYNEMFPDLK